MQISKHDMKLLVGLACFLLLSASYFFGYRNYSEKRETVEEEIATLTEKYDGLVAKNVNREKYLSDTKENNAAMEEITSKYPSQVTLENEIYYTKLIEEGTKAKVLQMVYSVPESFYLDDQNVSGITGYKAVSTISIEGDYEQFKDVIDYINSSKERRVIDSINISTDATSGTLSGTIAYNDYYLEGANCTFEPDTIPASAAGAGVDSIFGSLVKN